jgi:hypothetical protein
MLIDRLIAWALGRLGLKPLTDGEYADLLVVIEEDGRRLLGDHA